MFYQNVLEMTRSQIQGQRYEEFCLLCHVGIRKNEMCGNRCASLFCFVIMLCRLCFNLSHSLSGASVLCVNGAKPIH